MPKRVWATKPFTANGRDIAAGEVVEAAVVYGPNYPKLFSTGYIVEVQQDDRLYEHSPTGFLFITANYRDTFARNWQQAQASGESAASVTFQQPAPVSLSASTVESTLDPRRRLYDRKTFEQEVRKVYFEHCDEHGQRPSKVMVAQHLKIPVSVRTLDRYLKDFNLPYPPQND
jgi:hypothetical protein